MRDTRGRPFLCLLVALAAGCAAAPNGADPPSPSGPLTPDPEFVLPLAREAPALPSLPPTQLPPSASCAWLRLEPHPPQALAGDAITIVATITNCGDSPFVFTKRCGRSNLQVEVLRGVARGDLVSGAPAAAAASGMHVRPCVGDPHRVKNETVSPEGSLTETFRWNGTFALDPCERTHGSEEHRCLQYAPALDGSQTIEAVLRLPSERITERTTVAITAQPPAPPARCGLALASDRASIVAGEPVRIVANFSNCEDHDVPFGSAACDSGDDGLRSRVEGGNGAGTLGRKGAADVDVWGYCLMMFVGPTVVPVSGYVSTHLEWNGTFAYRAEPCCRYVPAEPGTYVVSVTFVEEGEGRSPVKEWIADLALEVVASSA